ncbi:MAG: PaaI family thioesterase [Acidimicrobiales bacterium]
MTGRDMGRWLGDGGMALVGALGASLQRYGVDGEDLGWVEGEFSPTALACNPHGLVQAGVHATVLDAAMNFAINAALGAGERAEATLEIGTELLRAAHQGTSYALRGDVVRLTRRIAFAEARVVDGEGRPISRATATFLVRRAEGGSAEVGSRDLT